LANLFFTETIVNDHDHDHVYVNVHVDVIVDVVVLYRLSPVTIKEIQFHKIRG